MFKPHVQLAAFWYDPVVILVHVPLGARTAVSYSPFPETSRASDNIPWCSKNLRFLEGLFLVFVGKLEVMSNSSLEASESIWKVQGIQWEVAPTLRKDPKGGWQWQGGFPRALKAWCFGHLLPPPMLLHYCLQIFFNRESKIMDLTCSSVLLLMFLADKSQVWDCEVALSKRLEQADSSFV